MRRPRLSASANTPCATVSKLQTTTSPATSSYSRCARPSRPTAKVAGAGRICAATGALTWPCSACLWFAKKRNYPKGEVIPLRQALKICVEALWGLMTMFIILGGILSGVFTATESAAVAVVWAFFVTMFIYRDYKWRELPKMLHRTVRTLSIVMILIAFAAAFGYIMTLMQIPSKITTAFLTFSDNRYVILMCVNFMLLALGTLMDMAPLILILTPILLPVVTSFGVDPVHFGMIMLVNLGIGLITPPVGAVLFVGAAIGKVTIENTVKALLPFYAALFMVLMAVTYIPAISLWLPSVVL
ncbi:TRAP transporter large permease [Pseudomonas chengduensis]|nr:TRAP transporter large permease [Pseudomonas chengduensis]MDH1682040.1 TRAP transporter large permease [Pseudomonas chengduensis]